MQRFKIRYLAYTEIHTVFKAYLKETLKVVAVLRHYDIKGFLTFITQKMLKINILNPFFMF